jgi:tRNA modification GTPase
VNPDEVVAVGYRGPASYSGDDVVELSFHGSPYIVRTALSQLIHQGCRLAEPGEFTRRAFLNGKLDLSQAEAVADIIASESAAGHALAFRQLKGSVSRRMDDLRTELIDTTALLELELDFSEEDVEFASRERLLELLNRLQEEIGQLVGTFALGQALKEGVPTALLGEPNAGKSTLLNALLREDRALAAASDPLLLATDLADRLVEGGVPFRKAQEIVGGLVAVAQETKTPLHKLDAAEFAAASPVLTPEIVKATFDLRAALAARGTTGAPSPENIQRELSRWREQLR